MQSNIVKILTRRGLKLIQLNKFKMSQNGNSESIDSIRTKYDVYIWITNNTKISMEKYNIAICLCLSKLLLFNLNNFVVVSGHLKRTLEIQSKSCHLINLFHSIKELNTDLTDSSKIKKHQAQSKTHRYCLFHVECIILSIKIVSLALRFDVMACSDDEIGISSCQRRSKRDRYCKLILNIRLQYIVNSKWIALVRQLLTRW